MTTLYPAGDPATGLVHLARTEARGAAAHALFAICPDAPRRELELVPDEVHPDWCSDCSAYLAHIKPRETLTLAERAERMAEKDLITRALARGNANPSPPAPAWMLEQEGDGER